MGRSCRPVLNSQLKLSVLNGRVALAILTVLCIFLASCSTAKRKVEAPPAPVAQVDEPLQASKLPPPSPDAVQEAVKRVFKDSVVIDTSREPHFLAGDFNGDLSQDIAVVLKPAPDKVSDLNEEFPTWILRDLSGPPVPGNPRLRVGANDVLLAVIHGYGTKGWHDEQATQTFLLKNAVGSHIEAHPPKDVATRSQGKKVPPLRGDVIAEVLQGNSGYLYYAGATYSWYDPKNYKGEPEQGVFHMRPEKTKK